MTDKELLQLAIENGMLSMDQLEEQMKKKQKQEILSKHAYAIWQGKDLFWRTYLPDDTKGRKLIKRKTESGLLDYIVSYYVQIESYTFKTRFTEWVNRQQECGRSNNTVSIYLSDYNRFFKDDPIEYADIRNIDDEYINKYLVRLLNKKDIYYKALKQLFGYLNGIFNKSIKDKIITDNPCRYIDLPTFKKYCLNSKEHVTEKRTFSYAEQKSLLERLNWTYNNLPEIIVAYAVELALYTGMRAGELSALRWDDIRISQGCIKICHAECYDRITKEYNVIKTKDGKERYFPLTAEIVDLLERVKQAEIKMGFYGEYVFMDADGRIHARHISHYAVNKTRSNVFANRKGIHAIRRTVNSEIRNSGATALVASSLLGHTPEVNNNHYTYDITDLKTKKQIIENALSKS